MLTTPRSLSRLTSGRVRATVSAHSAPVDPPAPCPPGPARRYHSPACRYAPRGSPQAPGNPRKFPAGTSSPSGPHRAATGRPDHATRGSFMLPGRCPPAPHCALAALLQGEARAPWRPPLTLPRPALTMTAHPDPDAGPSAHRAAVNANRTPVDTPADRRPAAGPQHGLVQRLAHRREVVHDDHPVAAAALRQNPATRGHPRRALGRGLRRRSSRWCPAGVRSVTGAMRHLCRRRHAVRGGAQHDPGAVRQL